MHGPVKEGMRGRAMLAVSTILVAGCAACRDRGDGVPGKPDRPARVGSASDAARPADPSSGGTAGKLRGESRRFMPEPYGDLRIGEPKSEVLAAHPRARPNPNPADPERLDWLAFTGDHGVRVMLGFGRGDDPDARPLESVEFMSLLAFPAPPGGSPAAMDPETRRWWLESVYAPHVAALRDRYGEKADVYSCPAGGRYPVVRVVWRGDVLAVTVAFMMGESGLASTLIVRRAFVDDRYLKATRCTWMQDKLM